LTGLPGLPRRCRPERPQEGGDGAGSRGAKRRRIAGICRSQQAAVMDVAARQGGELLGGDAGVGDGE